MDPNNAQFTINCPCIGNAAGCPGPALPRSFTRAGHGRRDYRSFPPLSIALSPAKSFTHDYHRRQACVIPSSLSRNHSRDPLLDLFSIAIVGGNSRALLLAIVRGNQTRILFMLDFAWSLFSGFIAAHQSAMNLHVPYTVTTGTLCNGLQFCNE